MWLTNGKTVFFLQSQSTYSDIFPAHITNVFVFNPKELDLYNLVPSKRTLDAHYATV